MNGPERARTSRRPSHTLRIEPHVYRAIVQHALSDRSRETCGLLGGRNSVAQRFYPVANVATDPACRYEMDPAQQIAALRAMRMRGEQLLAIMHSHPDSAALPSAADIAEANYPEAVYVIASLRGAEPELRGFWLQPRQEPRPVQLEVAPERGVRRPD